MSAMRCSWQSCLLGGLLVGGCLAMASSDSQAQEESAARKMTLAQFMEELQAEKQRGAVSRQSTVTTTTESVGVAAGQGAGLVSLRPPTTDTEEEVLPTALTVTQLLALDIEELVAVDVPTASVSSQAAVRDTAVSTAPASSPGIGEVSPAREGPDLPGTGVTQTSVGSHDPLETVDVLAAGSLDLEGAVRQAVSSHPAIAQSLGQLYATLEEVDVARSGYFPSVRSSLGSGYRGAGSRPWDGFNITASQMLYDFGKVSNSVDAASSGADRNRAAVLQAMDDLARDTADAFVEVQRYQALLEIAREQTDAITEIQELADARSRLGASSRSDSLQALSRRDAAAATELQLQAQLDLWKRTLQNYTGRQTPARVDEEFSSALDMACQASSEDFAQAPRVMVAEAELAEARARTDQARADIFPTFSVNANYGNMGNTANTVANPVLDSREFSVALSVDSTLFQGGALRARRRAAAYSLQAAQAGREAALLVVTRSFREARDQSRSFSERLRYLDARYDNVVSSQALYRQQYLSLGTRTLLDVLNTEQEIHQARFDKQQTLHDLRRMNIACLHSVGGMRDAFGIDSRPARGIRMRP